MSGISLTSGITIFCSTAPCLLQIARHQQLHYWPALLIQCRCFAAESFVQREHLPKINTDCVMISCTRKIQTYCLTCSFLCIVINRGEQIHTGLVQETEQKFYSPDIPLRDKASTFVVIITLQLSTFRHVM